MPTFVIFEFPYNGPWGDDMTAAVKDLAHDIAAEEGLLWKVWIDSQERGTAGGAYLFASQETAQRYIEKHESRLPQLGISTFEKRVFDVNSDLTAITLGGNPVLPAK